MTDYSVPANSDPQGIVGCGISFVLMTWCIEKRFFFSILAFLIIIPEPANVFFKSDLLSRVNPSGVTDEVVAPIKLTRLKRLVHARSPRWLGWCHVVSVAPVRSA
jgi:hypothetical protein